MGNQADPWYFDSNYYTKGAKDPSSDYYWYERTNYVIDNKKYSPQVSRILMSGGTSASANVKEIHFADGRNLTLFNQDYKTGTTAYDSKFNPASSCPKASCPVYADIVFVIDNSGSVDGTEWSKTADFVNNVIDTFVFGDDAVEAAIVQFNGPCTSGSCGGVNVGGGWDCSRCSKDYTWRSSGNTCSTAFPGRDTANVMAGGKNNGEDTVTESAVSLKNIMSGNRPAKYGNTCQGYGLELAIQLLQNSPRRLYSKVPQPIIIAVTDGQDLCPNHTADMAEKVRNEFGAFLIEIGVGLTNGCNQYDKKYLQNISSSIGSSTTKAYYDVSDYNAIHTVTEQLFKPLCSGFNADCGPDCMGFCGCGKCFCPTCDDSGTSCMEYVCETDSGHEKSDGCVAKDIPCETPDDICTVYKCDGTKTGSDRCYAEENPSNTCRAKREANPGTCRKVLCDTSITGGCYVTLDDKFCQDTYGNMCEKYACTPEGQAVDEKFKDTGCYLKQNLTLEKEQELASQNKSCFIATCNKNSGVTGEEDACPITNPHEHPKCYDSKCQAQDNGQYKCVHIEKDRTPSNGCVEYTCDHSKGWVRDKSYDRDSCTAFFRRNDANATWCMNVKCDPLHCVLGVTCSYDEGGGCVMEKKEDCVRECNEEMNIRCANQARGNSTSIDHCVAGSCEIVTIGEDESIDKCTFDISDCYAEMTEELSNKNRADPSQCRTPVCGEYGQCKEDSTPRPTNPPDTACMEWVCKMDANKDWIGTMNQLP